MYIDVEIWFDDESKTFRLPAKYVVCNDCEGAGKTLLAGMRYHAYTQDEMEELGPEFREDYFSGRYDELCRTCKGDRVVLVPDEEACILNNDKDIYDIYIEQQNEREADKIADARTRWAENGYQDEWQSYLD